MHCVWKLGSSIETRGSAVTHVAEINSGILQRATREALTSRRTKGHEETDRPSISSIIQELPTMSAPFGGSTGLEGSHGILYICGEKTGGKLAINESLLGRKIRGIHGGYDQFVAVVDAWELEWEQHCDSGVALEHEIVNDGLQQVKIHQVATGKQHRLALSLDGQIFSWGTRDSVFQNGELGQVGGHNGPRMWKSDSKPQRVCISPEVAGDDDDVDVQQQQVMMNHSNTICQPHRVHASKELFFRKVACGRSHSAAVTDKGDLYTWGRNFEGQLGHFSRSLSKEENALLNGICAWPKFVSVFLSKPRVFDVSCGDMFTVVLLENGAICSFGERFTGITRYPEAKTDSSPHLLIERGSDGAGFVGIACGFAHALAVSSSGQLYSWGWNNYGQLGLGNVDSSAIPKRVEVPDLEWTRTFAGGNYSAAVTSTGELFTWGNGRHGQLAHGSSSSDPRKRCEYAPKCVEALHKTVISGVVCGQRDLYAFAPTHIASISPVCGEITGGYELRIKGSGLWASEDLTVRFTPLTEGRLPRGSLGVYDEDTQEIICQVPKFSLAGEFAVEVAMNGKHFTSNGNVFSAFKRPQVTAVSIYEARLEGGEAAAFTLEGNLPKSCLKPIIRFFPCTFDSSSSSDPKFQQSRDMAFADVLGRFDSCVESADNEGDQAQQSSSASTSTRVLHFVTPPFSCTTEILPCLMEISYNDGLHFVPVTIAQPKSEAPAAEERETRGPLQQHVVWYHNAHALGVRPNSFLMSALPQVVHIDVEQLLPDCGGISAQLRANIPASDGGDIMASVTATLQVQKITADRTVTCTIPPLSQWEYSEVAPDKLQQDLASARSSPVGDWWKQNMPRTGFRTELQVSMNGGKSCLPTRGKPRLEVFALPAVGSLWSVFPPVGILCGGTKVSVSGDFFHFDTPDAVVSLQWRDKYFQVPAVCSRLSADASGSTESNDEDSSKSERRVVFQTPPLPFPNDRETAAAIAEGLVLGSHEEVDVFVALDGSHFADKSLKFVYCPVPAVLDITPMEAEPGTKMALRVERLVVSPNACVRLTSASMGISAVRFCFCVLILMNASCNPMRACVLTLVVAIGSEGCSG